MREGLSLEPAIAFYNAANFSNFSPFTTSTLVNTTTAGDPTGINSSGFLNGTSGFGDYEQNRIQRGSGTTDIGGPRSAEFQLKLNF